MTRLFSNYMPNTLMPTLTCSKRYDDLPFAHRQPNHDGHCALVHGHNWSFEFTFAAKELDACGFVIDFGKLKPLRRWLEDRFDHTLVLNESDPFLQYLQKHLDGVKPGGAHEPVLLAKIIPLPDCSCEGLAVWLLAEVSAFVQSMTSGRVSVVRAKVIEDSKNHATAEVQP